jgi:large repetitive protein
MKISTLLHRRLAWMNLPTAALLALLQRTPVLNLLVAGNEFGVPSPNGAVLKSAATFGAFLGAIDAMAGATTLIESNNSSSVSAQTGQAIQPVVFGVSNTINIGSWSVGGALPPGVVLSAAEDNSTLSGPGTLDATGSVSTQGDGYYTSSTYYSSTTPILQGTPSQAGTYNFTLQAFEFGGKQGLASAVYNYSVVVGGSSAGSGTSSTTTTTPTSSAPPPPNIANQPQGLTVNQGQPAVFVAYSSAGGVSYQWTKNGTNIAGATAASLTIPNPQTSDAGTYAVVVTAGGASATSSNATLSVNSNPAIPTFTSQPIAQSVASGGSVTFSAAASGNPMPSYQWFQNGNAIQGASGPTLLIVGAGSSSGGSYNCVATNASGSAQSNQVALAVVNTSAPSVAAASSGTSLALSTLGSVPSGGNFSTNFTISGTTAETVLVRAVGPGLTPVFGTSGAVPNPQLQLQPQGQSTVLAANAGWGSDQAIANATTAEAAFPLQSNSRDAAVLLSLQPGTYTAQVSDLNGNAGTVLVQVIQVP